VLNTGTADALPRQLPAWVVDRLRAAGGAVPFATYMDWALHDPDHGAYGSGRLRIGPHGDFATSPSLGPDFASLLLRQVAGWLEALGPGPLLLVETGPGEGSLARDLACGLAAHWPHLASRTALLLLEPNGGMEARQRVLLADCPLPVRWLRPGDDPQPPGRGVVLAHEVLDALPVERIVWDGGRWCRQIVVLQEPVGAAPRLVLAPGDPLAAADLSHLALLATMAGDPGLLSGRRPGGWCTEVHPALAAWLQHSATWLDQGWLLVIDYAMEARRYYAPARSDGTLMAYRRQRASHDPLQQPGHWDLTCHLCLESLAAAAVAAGWQPRGHCRQGQALLALGLAGQLHGLQAQGPEGLAERLSRRESLLRLVDPAALGEFRWFACSRGVACADDRPPLFLREPPPEGAWPGLCGQD
jgi:SAM-dependent MidA family methyltransferase